MTQGDTDRGHGHMSSSLTITAPCTSSGCRELSSILRAQAAVVQVGQSEVFTYPNVPRDPHTEGDGVPRKTVKKM